MSEATTFTKIKDDMKAAMKAREVERLGTIRLLIAALNNQQIEVRRDLTEEDILAVLATEAKKRREGIESFRELGREDAAVKEEAELAVIEEYLPQQLTDAEVGEIVDELIASTGASAPSDMGRVMGPLMAKIKGRFDGGQAKSIVMAKLK